MSTNPGECCEDCISGVAIDFHGSGFQRVPCNGQHLCHTTAPTDTPHKGNADWEKEFERTQKSVSYTDYTNKRFCCGGDYCQGDHLGFIKDFIRQTIAQAVADERQRTLEIVERILGKKADKYNTKWGVATCAALEAAKIEIAHALYEEDTKDI